MSTEKRLLLIGGGGHCRSILDCVLSAGMYEQAGIVDFDRDASALGVSVVGNDNDLPALLSAGWDSAFISVGSVGSTGLRRRLYKLVKELGFTVPAIIDPTAAVARGTEIGEGVFIGKRAVVNTGAALGPCAIVNTGAVVEHDCRVGAFAHISPGALLCGQVRVGEDAHVGAGSAVRQGISVGSRAVIGMGSVVVKDIPEGVLAYGNPCRVVSK